MTVLTRLVAAMVLGAAPLAAQDGARYPVPGGPLVHAATKGAVSSVATLGLRTVGLRPIPAALLGSVGVWSVAKSLELAKGHRLGRLDTLHDLGWHLAGSVVITLRGRTRVNVTGSVASLIVLTRCASAPQWGC
jgi:hypothetical protein